VVSRRDWWLPGEVPVGCLELTGDQTGLVETSPLIPHHRVREGVAGISVSDVLADDLAAVVDAER
jgi:hypothetical protein